MSSVCAFFSYANADRKLADQFRGEFEKKHVICETGRNLHSDSDFTGFLQSEIEAASVVLILLTENSVSSRHCLDEMMCALRISEERDKKIIILAQNSVNLNFQMFSSHTIISLPGKDRRAAVANAAARVERIVSDMQRQNRLTEKYMEYLQAGHWNGQAQTLCDLILVACSKIENEKSRSAWEACCGELSKYYDALTALFSQRYFLNFCKEESADRMRNAIREVRSFLESPAFPADDAVCLAAALHLKHQDYVLSCAYAYFLTDGDAEKVQTQKQRLTADYQRRQGTLLEAWHTCRKEAPEESELAQRKRDAAVPELPMWEAPLKKPPEESPFEDAPEDEFVRILASEPESTDEPEPEDFYCWDCRDWCEPPRTERTRKKFAENPKLHQIAEIMYRANQLFDEASAQVNTEELLKCRKMSYERLQKYCKLLGEEELVEKCIEKISQLNGELRPAAEDEEDDIQKDHSKVTDGLRMLLGLKTNQTRNFDVFLSYKHEAMDIVRNVYHFLQGNLLKVFFDKATLPELSRSDYEDAIYQSIDGAQHLVLIITDLSQLKSKWIRLEYGTFLHERNEGRKKNSNVILLISAEVDRKIRQTNKVCLPIQLRGCECMLISSYRESILSYLS